MNEYEFMRESILSLSNNEVNSLLKSFEYCNYSNKKRTVKSRKEDNNHD